MPDAFNLLMEDHREVEGLFRQFEQTSDPQVALKICDELTVHAMIEEELIYPILATKVSHSDSDEARREHEEAKGLIAQIEQGVRAQDDVSALVKQLREGVQHHVQEEESEVFPKMQRVVPGIVDSLGNDIVARKQQLVAQIEEARANSQPSTVVGSKPTAT